MRKETLTFVFDQTGKVILGLDCDGKLNGFKGHDIDMDDYCHCARRSLVSADIHCLHTADIKSRGQVIYYREGRPVRQVVLLFLHEFTGTPKDTKELRDLKSYPRYEVPMKEMPQFYEKFIPELFDGKGFMVDIHEDAPEKFRMMDFVPKDTRATA